MSNQVHCRRPVRNLTLTGCFAAVLGGLILFLCLVCVSVTVTLNFRPLYYLDMKLLHISDSSGYSNDVIRKNFDALIRYNNIWHTGILNFPDFPMSESGRIHFEEVKKVFSVFSGRVEIRSFKKAKQVFSEMSGMKFKTALTGFFS